MWYDNGKINLGGDTMAILEGLRPQEALHYFEALCAIPHGSRDTKRISDYCLSLIHI